MRLCLLKTVLMAAVMLLGLDVAHALQPLDIPGGRISNTKNSPDPKKDEREAAEELAKLGIPLQKDPQGVVRWIEAAKGEFNDEAMKYLPSLSRLVWLEIGGGGVTLSGMEYLKKCHSLRRLYVHDIDLSKDTLAWLAGLPNLEALSLQRTGISGSALQNLKARDTLVVLNLSGDQITDDTMDQIARFKGLDVLALADTKITGMGIGKLEGMPRLNELNMMNCKILDSDLEYFLSMPNLRIVYAEGCNISDMAVYGVVSRFPMLAIFR
jgi:Leucine-rich repeat (LRR) protein